MGHRGSCYDLCQKVFCMFSSKWFIASGLTCRSLIHFIFGNGVRKCSNFILLQVTDHFCQHLLKRLSFLHCIFFPPLSKIRCPSFLFNCSVISDCLGPHGLLHSWPPCPSSTPRVHSNSSPSNQWCLPTIPSSVIPFSSCLKSFPESGSFPISQFFASGGQVLEFQLQHQSFQWPPRTDLL